MASGALSLSENYVVTREAFRDYLDHLTPEGVIFFSRPDFSDSPPGFDRARGVCGAGTGVDQRPCACIQQFIKRRHPTPSRFPFPCRIAAEEERVSAPKSWLKFAEF